MVKTQIIRKDEEPFAVILDYQEYLRLKGIEQDNNDYRSALAVKKKNKTWINHENLKKDLGM
jgi:ribosomal protein S4E